MFDRAAAIHQIQQGRCPCQCCDGTLTDPARSKGGWGFCRDCSCAWQVSASDGHGYAATVPSELHRPPPTASRPPIAFNDRHG
jgi:hypothetical protein